MSGKTLSHFRIIETLGAGGMGVVYRVHDEQHDRDVAIKVLPAASFDDPSARARLLQEEGRVHVTAQLIEAVAERHLSAETYNRPAADVLRFQSEVAWEIARQINVTMTSEQASRVTSACEVNHKVYEAYLRGKSVRRIFPLHQTGIWISQI
jgi:serine/threonine protein kinase